MSKCHRRSCGLIVIVAVLPLTPVVAEGPWWTPGEPYRAFVTVDLESYYHDRCIGGDLGDGYGVSPDALPPADRHVAVAGIPFYISKRTGGDNLDLRRARWPDVERDPVDFYFHYQPKLDGDPECPVVHVPNVNYSAAYLLCMADTDTEKLPIVSLRFGLHDGYGYLYDSEVTVPRWNDPPNANVVGSGEVTLVDRAGGKRTGRVFVVRAPIRSGETQELAGSDHLDLELTKSLHLAVRQPDPNRFRIRPLGRPSAVHVFALSLERSPVQMTVTSPEIGNIFTEPAVPTFDIVLSNTTARPQPVRIDAIITDFDGKVHQIESTAQVPSGGKTTKRIEIPPSGRGWFEIMFRLTTESHRPLVDRTTTFALLPPDTRQATFRDSPFGTWCFGMAHRGVPIEKSGPLLQKVGIRRTLGIGDDEQMKEYGLTLEQFPSIVGTHSVTEADRDNLRAQFGSRPDTDEAMVFHESNIGPIMTHPAFVVGERPAPLDEDTEKELQRRLAAAVAASKAAREVAPQIKLVFGNMTQPALEQFLSRGYPAEYIDLLGEESPGFMRMPERQPEVAGFGSLWWMKEMARHYGYDKARLAISYEWMYHSTNPGNNPEPVAAAYNVRDCLLALAYGVPHVNPALIHDVGNAYYFSNWGAAGLCRRPPEINPKPGYVAYATMTRMLDLAVFSRKLETGSTSVFTLEFKKPKGSKVYALWTIRGERDVRLTLAKGDAATLTDGMSNERRIDPQQAAVRLAVGAMPVYVSGVEIQRIEALEPRYEEKPGPDAKRLSALDTLNAWSVNSSRDADYEKHVWDQVQRPGVFAWRVVTDSVRGDVIEAAIDGPQSGPDVASYYNTLESKKPISLPGTPREIGVWVLGNSSWGRIVFELADAKGETWTHTGAAQTNGGADWNTVDTESTSYINFDGWRFVGVALPGQHPFDHYHWPRNGNWRHVGGDGIVDYPLALTRITVEMREKLVYIDELVDVTRRSIRLGEIFCSY
ncbi:MAG: hypothetical protein ABGZ35_02255 [Planctomycetaceae bacterium]